MERKECGGAEIKKGKISLEECFNLCKGSTSYMIWGEQSP